VRYDHYDNFGGTTNPRLALIYRPKEKTAFKLLYGTAFRAPNSYEMFYSGGGQEQNSQLKPETIQTSELVVEQALGKNFRFTASTYRNRIGDLISQGTDPTNGQLVFQNMDKVMAKGLELELEGKFASALEGRLSYALQHTHYQDTGTDLSNSPYHLAKLNVSAPLLHKRLFAGLDAQYVSRRETLHAGSVAAFAVFNATVLSRNLGKGFDVSASIYNLFDKRYADPGAEEHRQESIQQDGRSFRVKISYRFGKR
jgi:outer membrane receptor for ferrienterochelin and colicins